MASTSEYSTIYKRTLQAAAATPAVTTAEAKDWCYVTGTDHDVLIANLVKAATAKIETDYDCALITQTWDFTFDRFPTTCWENPDAAISPVIYPVQSVTHIKYTNTAGTADTTFDSANYTLEKPTAMPARVLLAYGQSWPSVQDTFNAVQMRLVCGFGAAPSDIPETLRTAILLMVKYWYDNPEDNYIKGASWERSAKVLCQNYFTWRL